MDNRPLHPNLARIAAAYDDVLRRFSIRQIDATAARSEILALQARDDEGVVWTIDPDNGDWKRRTRAGQWVVDTPPAAGLATLTAHDLSRDPRLFNPDSRVRFEEADTPVHGLRGAVRGKVVEPAAPDARSSGRRVRVVIACVVVGLLLVVGITQRGDALPVAPVTVLVP